MPSLAKNTLYLTFASIAQKAIAFFYFALIARYFDVEGTGAYFLSLAIVTIVMVLDDLGLTSVVIREVAKKPSDAVIWNRTVLGVKLVTMPLTVVVAYVVPRLLGYGSEISQLVSIGVIVMLADTLSLSFYGILRGMQDLRFESLGIFLGQCLTSGIGLTLILLDRATLPLLVIALAIGSLWNLALSGHLIRVKLGWNAFIPSWSMGWKPLKMAFMFFLAAVFVKIYSYTDSIVLSKFIDQSAVGIYSVSYKFTYAFQFLPLAFIGALYPVMSAQSHDLEKLKKTLMDSFWYMAILVAPIVFGLWAIAPEVIYAVYGDKYGESILVLQILIFVLVPIFLDFPLGSLLNATNNQTIKTVVGGATVIVNVVANLLLISLVGIPGAAIAAIMTSSFMLFVDWFYIRRIVKISLFELARLFLPIFASAAVMALVVIGVKNYVHFAFAIPVGALIYFCGLSVTGVINRTHVLTMKSLAGRRTGYVQNPPTND